MPACGLHRDPPKVSAACSYYDSDRRVKLGEVRVAWQKRAQVFARLGAAAAFLRADCAVFMVVSVPLALLRARDAADDARQKGVVEHPRLAAGVPRQQPDRHTAEVGAVEVESDAVNELLYAASLRHASAQLTQAASHAENFSMHSTSVSRSTCVASGCCFIICSRDMPLLLGLRQSFTIS